MRIKETESDIQNAVCEWLALHKFFFWRQNSSGIYNEKTGGWRKSKWSINGVSDIIVLVNTFTYFIEVKTPTGHLSPAQREFKRNVENAGGKYFVVRSLKDLEEIF